MGSTGQVQTSAEGVSLAALAWARVVVASLLATYVLLYKAPQEASEPTFLLPAAMSIVVAFLIVSLIQLGGPQRWRESPIPFILVDATLAMAFISLFAFDPQKYLFAIGFGVVLEAALLLGLTGAVVTCIALSLFYAVKESLGYAILDVPTEPVGVLLRSVVLLGVALTTGSLVEANRAGRALYKEQAEADRLRAMDEMKDALLAAVSHDLKNPLTAILGFSTTLEARLDRLPPERALEFVGHITHSARRLEQMLSDLLDMDRVNRGVLEPHLTPTNMGALVRDTIEEIDLNNRALVIDADEVMADVDAPKVERIVENLVTNALKYTPAYTDIDLSVQGQNGGVLIAVEDRGQGIPDEHKDSVFGEFRRLPGSEKVAKGTGVGLSLVSKFAELHGGRAWVEDRPGGGASFRVYLPREAPASNS